MIDEREEEQYEPDSEISSADREENLEKDPFRETTNKLYTFAESIKGDVVVKDGKFNIEIGSLRTEIKVDPFGKVSYELFDGDESVLGQENIDLETIFANIKARVPVEAEVVDPSFEKEKGQDQEISSADREANLENGPFRETTNKLYTFAESIKGDVVVKDGKFNIEIGSLRAEIDVDPSGKVSYELFDGDERVLGGENADVETIFDSIKSRVPVEAEVVDPSYEMEVVPGKETLGSEAAGYLEEALRARMKEQGGALEALAEVDVTLLTEQGREQLVAIEARFVEERERIQELAAKSELGIVGAALERTLEFLDLNTREKVFAAALEVIPYVGAVYAVAGKRLVFERSESGAPIPKLEDITWTDRGLYLAGELLVSGHVLRGIKQAILANGVKEFAKATGKLVAKKSGQVIVKRAQKGARKEMAQLTGHPAA